MNWDEVSLGRFVVCGSYLLRRVAGKGRFRVAAGPRRVVSFWRTGSLICCLRRDLEPLCSMEVPYYGAVAR